MWQPSYQNGFHPFEDFQVSVTVEVRSYALWAMRTKCLDIEDVVDISIEIKAVTASIPDKSLREGHQFNPERGADVGKWMVATTAPSSAIKSTFCLPTIVILLGDCRKLLYSLVRTSAIAPHLLYQFDCQSNLRRVIDIYIRDCSESAAT